MDKIKRTKRYIGGSRHRASGRWAALIAILVLVFGGALCLAWGKRLGSQMGSSVPSSTPPTHAPQTSQPVTTTTTARVPADSAFVRVVDYIPNILVELKYATTDNITGKVIYDFTDAYLRYGTVKKLIPVQHQLNELGYSLKIWDAFRPMEAQFKLWDAANHNANYIANPNNGPKSHNVGNTVDITLVKLDGSDVEMPTGFDNFTDKADLDFTDVTPEQANNAQLLQDIMVNSGFKTYIHEWWHFEDTVDYAYDESFNPASLPETKK